MILHMRVLLNGEESRGRADIRRHPLPLCEQTTDKRKSASVVLYVISMTDFLVGKASVWDGWKWDLVPFELLQVFDIKGIVPSTVQQDLCLINFEQVAKSRLRL